MKITAIRAMFPAPKNGSPSVSYYITASLPALSADAEGNVKDKGNVVFTQWKKIGASPAVVSNELNMDIFLVDADGSINGYGNSGNIAQLSVPCSACNGYLSILAELSEQSNVVFSLAVPIVRSGADSIVLDLSNENDSMLYDGEGNLLSGKSVSVGTLLAGGADITSLVKSDGWSLNAVGATATQQNGVITVEGMTADSATAELSAAFNGRTYKAVMTLKKLVGVDKYELHVTPNAITHNKATGKASASKVRIEVYRTAQNGERTLVQNLAEYGLSINFDYNNESTSSSGSISGYSSGVYKDIFTIWDYYRFYLIKGGKTLDAETVPISSSSDAVVYTITDAGSYFRYDPNTQTAAVRVKGWLKKTIGTSSEPVANREVYFDDDKNVIKTAIQNGTSINNRLVTDANGLFDYVLNTDVTGLHEATLINVQTYENGEVLAAMTIHKVVAGVNGEAPKARYSKDKSSWHDEFEEGDIWMQLSMDGGNTWGEAVHVVGEPGTNGSYVDYSFNLSKQLSSSNAYTSPSDLYGDWQDAPLTPVSTHPYLWCRQTPVDSNGKPGTPIYYRITGEKGPKGDNSVTYKLRCTPAVVKYNPNTKKYSADYVNVVVQRIDGGNITELKTGADLGNHAVVDASYYQYDSQYYLSNYTTGILNVSVQDILSWDDCEMVLHDWTDESIIYDTFRLTVVRDGEQGKPGKMYYYAGKFTDGKEYTATDNQAPYVDFDWEDTVTVDGIQTKVTKTSYYVLVAGSSVVNGTYVKPRTTAASGVWELMETSFKFVITEAMFTAFGKLGSAVFSGDWMISQHGTPGRILSDDSRIAIALVTDADYRYTMVLRAATSQLPAITEQRGPVTINEIANWSSDGTHTEYVDGVAVEFPNLPDAVAVDIMDALGVTDDNAFLEFVDKVLVPDAQWAVSHNLTAAQLLELSKTSYQYFGWLENDPHAVWHPSLAMDLLTGKIISYDIEILGVLRAPIIFHGIRKISIEINEAVFAEMNDEIFKVFCLSSSEDDITSDYYINAGQGVVFIPMPADCEGKIYEFVANGAQATSGSIGFYVRTIGYDEASPKYGMANFFIPCLKNSAKFNGYLRIVSDGEEWTVISHVY